MVLVPPLETVDRERLDALERRLADLEGLVAQLRPVDDRTWAATVADVTEGHVFSVHDLMRHAAVNPRLQAVVRDSTPQQIAERLKRLCRHPVPGIVVTKVKEFNDGWTWTAVHQGD